MKTYSVIIVGAGPAGIFTALSLIERGINDIAIVDMGKDIFSRNRKKGKGSALLSGWGGAGAFSDGKLTLLCNADMGPAEVRQHCPLDDAGRSLLRAAMTQLGMSARAFHRILKLARTIADLESAVEIQTHHLAEAIQYRPRRQV